MTPCPNCGFANGESVKFCAECGTKLPGPSAGAGVVRRTVTVLFADVSGSTALGERLDPESLRALLGRYFTTMKDIIEHHGGRVEKFIGDAVMAVFGIPTLHEDDALRAVRAAAEIRDTLAALNQQLQASQGLAIVFRTGVNTGEVVAGDVASAQTLVTGDTVNTAARLEQATPPGEILLGEATYQLVRDAVVAEGHEPIAAKGKAQPVQAFRLISVTPGATGHARRLDTPMVGRVSELKALTDAFDRCAAERTTQLITLLGAAGVGKSRLIHEFRQQLEGQATSLLGRCLSYGEGITYWPLADALRAPAAVDPDNSVASWRAGLAALMAGQPQAESVVEQVLGLIGVGEAAGGSEPLWAVRRLLQGMARARPLVLVIDDVHWATPTFLDLIEQLAGSTPDAPILLVCVARPELIEARPSWGSGVTNASALRLEPLDAVSIDQLAEQLSGDTPLGAAMKRRIAAAADGNPLFVEELVAMLAERGELVVDGDGSQSLADPVALEVPPTIEALLAARLDQLPADERAVLGRASVVGKQFGAREVAYLGDQSAPASVPQTLLALVRRDLLHPDPHAMPPMGADDEGFQFRHQLIRDAAYAGMSKTERAHLHERYAGWLEELPSERLRQLDEVVGYHLEQAYALWAALGNEPSPSDTAQRAAAHLAAAGLRAYERRDGAAATNLLGRAAALLPPTDSKRIAFLPELATALMMLGRFGESEAVVGETLDATASGSDPAARVRALVRRAGLAAATKGLRATQRLADLEEALALAEASGDPGLLAAVRRPLTEAAMSEGKLSEARRALELALEAARGSGDRDLEGDVLSDLGSVTLEAISSAAAIDRVQRDNLLFAQEHGLRGMEADLLLQRAIEEARRSHFPEARRLLAESRAISDGLGTPILWALSALGRSWLEFLAGEAAARERVLREGYDQLSAIGERGFLSTVAAELADALVELGRVDEAAAMCVVAEEIGADDDVMTQVRVRLARGRVAAHGGDMDAALRLIASAVALAEETEFYDLRTSSRFASARIRLEVGQTDEARTHANEVLKLARHRGDVVLERMAKALIRRANSPSSVS